MRNLFQMQMAQCPFNRQSQPPRTRSRPSTKARFWIQQQQQRPKKPPRVPLKPGVTYRSAFPFRDRDYPYVLSLHIRQFRFGSSESSLIYISSVLNLERGSSSGFFLFAFGSRWEFVMDFLADGMRGYCVVLWFGDALPGRRRLLLRRCSPRRRRSIRPGPSGFFGVGFERIGSRWHPPKPLRPLLLLRILLNIHRLRIPRTTIIIMIINIYLKYDWFI